MTPTSANSDSTDSGSTGTGRPAPTAMVSVDSVVLTVRSGRLHTLLVEPSHRHDSAGWALPSGWKEPTESLEETAARVTVDLGLSFETGYREQLGSYSDPELRGAGETGQADHVVSVVYLSFVPDVAVAITGAGSPRTRFWAIDDLADGFGPALAPGHEGILGDGVERARAKLEYTTLATRFVPDPFSIGDLYEVYLAVWDVAPGDRANFSRKVKGTDGFVVRTPHAAPKSGRGRPSTLFTAGPATHLHPPILRQGPATSSVTS